LSNAIEMRGVRKTFGPKVAVDDLDLAVPEGAMYGFIGPNGAGKTTTIRMIMSILFPDRGELSVLGRASAVESKDRIGYLPEERGVYKKMKVGSFLAHMGKLKGMQRAGLKKTIHDWLERVDLGEVEKKKCEELSKGMQQKIQFIGTVLHEPDLVILDEPFSGLDPVNMRLLRDLIQEQNDAGRTVIFSTHVMYQAEQLCDHIVMIDDGKKVLDATLEEIRDRHNPNSLIFEPLNPAFDAHSLESIPGVARVAPSNGAFEIFVDAGTAPAELMPRILDQAAAAKIELHRPSLEDVFIEIAQGGANEQDVEHIRASLREDTGVAGGVGGMGGAS